MDKLKLSPANIVIMAGGVVILIASFLAFNKFSTGSVTIGGVKVGGGSASYSAWSSHYFFIATIPALLGAIMAAQVAVAALASGVKLAQVRYVVVAGCASTCVVTAVSAPSAL